MGGDRDRISPFISSTDVESFFLEQEIEDYPFKVPTLPRANQGRAGSIYTDVLRSYHELPSRIESLEQAKHKILRYNPGAWNGKVAGMKLNDYNVPEMTTLLLVGPEKSGKSSLVNRISRVFDDDKFSPERAQVSYNPNDEDGTYFLQEYMVLKGLSSFCLYDTRSLCHNTTENNKMLKCWITEGVCHGELVSRDSDGPSLRTRMKCQAHQNRYYSSKLRMVNFVIFVVSGLSVLNSMESDDEAEDDYNKMISTMFNCPFLSFRDDKPVVVVTHGDLLSLSDRARVRVHLGKLLGIPPKKQIFDIPDSCDPVTELTITDLLRYSLEHADKNLPGKSWFMSKVPQPGTLFLVLILGITIISALVHSAYFCGGHGHHAPQVNTHICWNAKDASQTDNPRGTNAFHSPQISTPIDINSIHAPQTDAPTNMPERELLVDQNAIHSTQTDTLTTVEIDSAEKDSCADWDAIHAPQANSPTKAKVSHSLVDQNAIHGPQKDTFTNTEELHFPTKDPFADSNPVHVPQTDATTYMALHSSETDSPTELDAIHAPQTDTLTNTKELHSPKKGSRRNPITVRYIQADSPTDTPENSPLHSPKKDSCVDKDGVHAPRKDIHVDWNAIRSLWLGSEYD